MSCTCRMRQQKHVESLCLTCRSRSWILLASPALSFAFLCCSLALLPTSIFRFSTCSVSLWVSAVAARSLAASLSSSSWFSAYHCSLFFSSVTSSRCFSMSIFSSKPLSPARYIQMFVAIKMTITLLKIDCCITLPHLKLLPDVQLAWSLARSRSFLIISRSTCRACFSCFSLWISSCSRSSFFYMQRLLY